MRLDLSACFGYGGEDMAALGRLVSQIVGAGIRYHSVENIACRPYFFLLFFQPSNTNLSKFPIPAKSLDIQSSH